MSIQRTLRTFLVLTASMLVLTACGGNKEGTSSSKAASGTGSSGCTPGVKKVEGVDAMVHCGPASASFTIDGTTTTVDGGSCISQGGAWILNVGATVVDTAASDEQRGKVSYVGIIAGKLDPNKTEDHTPVDPKQVDAATVLVRFTGGGLTDMISVDKTTFEVTGDEPSGTFSGPTVKGASVTGKFSCS